ncbi:MAG: rod shape-determining protein RodA [Alphaproteobacteria bacterium]|nr:rod shape-determining protein RodA [Alphaproteobacteria bacterium]
MSDIGFLSARLRRGDMSATEKLFQISWSFVFWLCCIAAFGFAMLYSAANGSLQPWAMPQMMRFGIGMLILIAVALIDVRLVMRYSYFFYALVMVLLLIVEVRGVIGGGAQRWIDLGFINLQPSELMKPAIVLALARYFQGVGLDDISHPLILAVPLALIGAPFVLIAIQPDLGTAGMILMGSVVMLFLAGVRLWKFAVVGAMGLAAIPIAWGLLREYQQKRVLTFLNPENDPLGAGYHILQSKIALGSGGLFGKGFMEGTQSHLNFLPERQTDFIFTMLAEELGLVGALTLIGLYVIVLIYGYAVAFGCRHQFGRMVALGLTTTFFLYFFINMAMVMGLIPVVGVPLPLISYGGTALFTLMFSAGILMNIWVHRDV